MPDDITNHESAEGYLKGAEDIQNGDTDAERTNALLTALVHAVLSLKEPIEAPRKHRKIKARVVGDNAGELEEAAMSEAWSVFGEGSQVSPMLAVVKDYEVVRIRERGADKKYFAHITVEVIE